jgi:SAM-dependent methyltransferase
MLQIYLIKMDDDLSLERIIPDHLDPADEFDQETLRLHLERYSFAIQNGQPGFILDMACGTGYGASQIIQTEKFFGSLVTAVDVDAAAIEYGKKRYASESIRFICSDALQFENTQLFNTIVSLETIEHLRDPALFVKKLHSLLEKGGTLIVSAPVTPSTDGNPHHLSDFTSGGFRKLFELSGFSIESQLLQVQRYSLTGIFHSKNKRIIQKRQGIAMYYLQHPGIFWARIRSLFMDGLKNKYLTIALRKN